MIEVGARVRLLVSLTDGRGYGDRGTVRTWSATGLGVAFDDNPGVIVVSVQALDGSVVDVIDICEVVEG